MQSMTKVQAQFLQDIRNGRVSEGRYNGVTVLRHRDGSLRAVSPELVNRMRTCGFFTLGSAQRGPFVLALTPTGTQRLAQLIAR